MSFKTNIQTNRQGLKTDGDDKKWSCMFFFYFFVSCEHMHEWHETHTKGVLCAHPHIVCFGVATSSKHRYSLTAARPMRVHILLYNSYNCYFFSSLHLVWLLLFMMLYCCFTSLSLSCSLMMYDTLCYPFLGIFSWLYFIKNRIRNMSVAIVCMKWEFSRVGLKKLVFVKMLQWKFLSLQFIQCLVWYLFDWVCEWIAHCRQIHIRMKHVQLKAGKLECSKLYGYRGEKKIQPILWNNKLHFT